jgi:hypothetical protein
MATTKVRLCTKDPGDIHLLSQPQNPPICSVVSQVAFQRHFHCNKLDLRTAFPIVAYVLRFPYHNDVG